MYCKSGYFSLLKYFQVSCATTKLKMPTCVNISVHQYLECWLMPSKLQWWKSKLLTPNLLIYKYVLLEQGSSLKFWVGKPVLRTRSTRNFNSKLVRCLYMHLSSQRKHRTCDLGNVILCFCASTDYPHGVNWWLLCVITPYRCDWVVLVIRALAGRVLPRTCMNYLHSQFCDIHAHTHIHTYTHTHTHTHTH